MPILSTDSTLICHKILQDTKSLEEKKVWVKGLGRKKTDELEHFIWKDNIKVPCGRLIPSEHKDSPLEYNEYAAFDPKQVKLDLYLYTDFSPCIRPGFRHIEMGW